MRSLSKAAVAALASKGLAVLARTASRRAQGQAPGQRVASVLLRIEAMPGDEAAMLAKLEGWFVAESLMAGLIVEGAAVVATEFRIDGAGHMRFAVFVRSGTPSSRVGRIVQRLCEVETYRAMSMLGLIRARELGAALNRLDRRLSTLMADLNAEDRSPEAVLHDLLTIAADLENMGVGASFRFGRPWPVRRLSTSGSKPCASSALPRARPLARS